MVTINTGVFAVFAFMLAALGSVVTIAVAWGVIRNKLDSLFERVKEVRDEVRELKGEVKELDKKVDTLDKGYEGLRARAEGAADRTGGHRPLVLRPKSE